MKLLFVVGFAILAFSGLNAQKLSLKDALGMPEANELDTVDMDVDNGLSDILSSLLDKISSATGAVYERLEQGLYHFMEYLIAPHPGILLKAKFKSMLSSLRKKIDYEPLKKLITKLIGDSNSKKLSLKDALGMPEANELDTVDMDVDNGLSDILSSLLDKISSATGAVYERLEQGLYHFMEYLIAPHPGILLKAKFKSMLSSLRKKIDYEPLKKLITKLIGDSNSTANSFVDKHYDEELLKYFLEELTAPDGLRKIRAYVETLASKSKLEVVHALRVLLHNLDDSKLKKILTSLLHSTNDSNDTIEEILRQMKGIGLQVTTPEPLAGWIKSKMLDIIDKLKHQVTYNFSQALGEEILEHGNTISKAVAESAEDFLSKYKSELGDLYKPLMQKLRSIKGATTLAPEY